MTFWERFYSLCLEYNTKPNPVAAEIGISSGTVTRWKNGQEPSFKALTKLSDYFNCSVDYLLGKTDVKNEQTTPNEQPVPDERKKFYEFLSKLSDEELNEIRHFAEYTFPQHKPEEF